MSHGIHVQTENRSKLLMNGPIADRNILFRRQADPSTDTVTIPTLMPQYHLVTVHTTGQNFVSPPSLPKSHVKSNRRCLRTDFENCIAVISILILWSFIMYQEWYSKLSLCQNQMSSILSFVKSRVPELDSLEKSSNGQLASSIVYCMNKAASNKVSNVCLSDMKKKQRP